LTIARPTVLCIAALAVLVAVPVALGAALKGGAKYAGKTVDGAAVQLRLTSNAQRVAKMRIKYTVTCDNGGSGKTYTDILNARVRASHAFSAAGKYTGASDGSVNRFKVAGKLTPAKASGTFSLTATGTTKDTGAKVVCKTGQLRWTAKRTR
jgi:hypothetical protein